LHSKMQPYRHPEFRAGNSPQNVNLIFPHEKFKRALGAGAGGTVSKRR